MNIQLALTIASPLISIAALLFSFLIWRANARSNRATQHYNHVSMSDRMIGENKNALRFHGIDPDTIEEKYGVTASDLAYLVQSFNSGVVSSILSGSTKTSAFNEGSYRYEILRHAPTQKAFPLVKMLFNPKNPYILRSERTIAAIKRKDTIASPGRSAE